ncbi:hypothetical protein D3C80_1921490 [compost metagenome]
MAQEAFREIRLEDTERGDDVVVLPDSAIETDGDRATIRIELDGTAAGVENRITA